MSEEVRLSWLTSRKSTLPQAGGCIAEGNSERSLLYARCSSGLSIHYEIAKVFAHANGGF
jgi:hypothetical protein